MKKNLYFILLLVISSMFVMCSDDDCAHDPTVPHITLGQTVYNLDRVGSAKVIDVNTNVANITCTVDMPDWCDAVFENGTLTISASSNTNMESREAKVFLRGDNVEACVIVTQDGRSAGIDELKDDIKLTVKSGEASSFQPGEGIEKSFDGDLSTMYHSAWKNSATDYFPITLTYNLENAESIDYLIYNPRQSGSNGLFKEVEIWVATEAVPTLTKYGDYDFKGNSTATKISFDKTIQKPTKVQFIVKSGAGDGQGFASCAEMEFFRNNPDKFDYLSVFTDHTCSELKQDMTEPKIDEIGNAFFRNLAKQLFLGKYESEFRVQTYKSWQHPDVKAKELKTSQYGLRDNPTGIYVVQGEELVVFMDQTDATDIALFIQNPEGKISGSSFPLSTGLNKFKANHDGLIYIMYYTDKGTEKPIKINIATGVVNGYFDSQKHKASDWSRLIGEATFKHFDLVGKHAVMTFETEAFRKYTPDGLALIDAYDQMVSLEQDFMGLNKYNKNYQNRAYFLGIYESYMYASSYYTAYNVSTQPDILDVDKFKTSSIWGPAHELGHTHQTRPGLKWAGMAEVTNNIHSLYVQTEFGNVSRLTSEGRYANAKAEIIDKKIAHNACEEVFFKLVPFWQLKLYLHNAQGMTDFYKDVYEAVRVNPDPATQGQCQIEFVKTVCDIAKLDLTDFFETWGFLTPIDMEIDDYGKSQFVVTQAMIDACKASIRNKNYAKPKHNNIHEITDSNVADFK